MELKVEYLDGTTAEARIIPFDLVGFERHYGIGFETVEAAPLVEHTMFLAWHSIHRSEVIGATHEDKVAQWEAWMATVADIDAPKADTPPKRNRSQRRSQQ